MGIEPTRDLLDPTLVLKTRGTTRHQSPPRWFISYFDSIIIYPLDPVNKHCYTNKNKYNMKKL